MPGIAGFLSGTISESLKKIVQPAGVVPATIFTLLNLAFVYPPAHSEHVGIADEFAGLSSAWQLAVITTIVFVLGYLLVNLAPSSVSTLAGDTWRGSPLHDLLTLRQAQRRKRLSERVKNPGENDNPAALSMQLASQFALPTPGVAHISIEPTRLGNVLLATQSQLYRRWGIDMTALWSQLESTAAVTDSPAIATAADEKATLQLMANLVMISAAFTLEAFVFDSLHRRWDSALAALLLLPAAYVCYRIAVAQARSWGDAVQVALDLHRNDLRQSLGLREATSTLDARRLWQQASRFFLPSQLQPDPGDLFDKAPVLGATASASGGVDAKIVLSDVELAPEPDPSPSPSPNWTLVRIRYLILVSRSGVACDAPEVNVLVADSRLDQAAAPAQVTQGNVDATATVAVDGSSVVWRVTGLDRGGAIPLNYTMPLWKLNVEGGTAVVRDEGPLGLRVDLTASSPEPLRLIAWATGPVTDAPTLRIGNEPSQVAVEDDSFSWTIQPATSRVWLALPELPL